MRWLLLLVLILPLAYADCEEAYPGMVVTSDTVLCQRGYNISEPITFGSDGVVLDCDDAIINCVSPLGMGVQAYGRSEVTLKNCMITGCQNALDVVGTHDSRFIDNRFLRNNRGIAFDSSHDNVVSGNYFRNNTYSFQAIRSVVDTGSVFSSNDYDVAPHVQDFQRPFVARFNATLSKDEARSALGPDEDSAIIHVNELIDQYFDSSVDDVKINRVFEFNGTHTIVTLEIVPVRNVSDVSVYESIPKCFAAYINEIAFYEKSYVVLKDDPLLMWHFDYLDDKQVISYSVSKRVSDDCLSLLKAFGLVKEYDVPSYAPAKKGFNKSLVYVAALVFVVFMMGLVLYRAGLLPVRRK